MKKLFTFLCGLIFTTEILNAQCSVSIINYTNTCNQVTFEAIGINGVAPYTYYIAGAGAIIDSVTGQTTITALGTYTVTAIDAVNCSASDTVVVNNINYFGLTVNAFPICNNSCNGTANLYPTGNGFTPPINYAVTGGATVVNNQVSNICTNTTYTVTATDFLGCTATSTIYLQNPPPISISITNISVPPCLPGCNGTAQVTCIDGVPPLNYSIVPSGFINGAAGAISLLCAGFYTVTVIDNNGCTATSVVSIPQSQGILTGNVNISNPTTCVPNCNGDGYMSISGGVAPYSYSIAPSGTIDTMGVFSNVCSGNFTVTVSDTNNCLNNFYANMPNAMNINGTIGVGSISANPTFGSPPYEFSLNGGPYTLNNTFTYLCSGYYTLSVKDANIPACIKDTVMLVTVSNTQFPGGTVVPIITHPSCNLTNDGSIALTITPPNTYDYLWSGGDTTNPIMNKSQGVYNVRIENPAGECISNTYILTPIGINCGSISGIVFLDTNYNCTQNAGEPLTMNKMIKTTPGNYTAITNNNGYYSITGIPYGNYTITNMNNLFGYFPNCNINVPVTLNAFNNVITQDFSDSNANVVDYKIYLNDPYCFIVPDTLKQRCIKYLFTPYNPIQLHTATIYAKFDSINHFLNAVPAPSFINGDTVFWNVSNVADTNSSIYVRFTFPANYTAANFAPFSYGIINTQFPDNDLLNNHMSMIFPFCNAWDPNNKLAIPQGEGPQGEINYYDPQNQLFTYYVNFQNTGNAPAYNVVIEDTISDKLDISTLEVLYATHNYTLEIKNGNILSWKFPYIMLPDSTTDFAGSKGTVVYKIKQAANNQIGDQIHNTAYIYFDNNPPIVTNTTLHTLADTLVIPNTIKDIHEKQISIYPNPAKLNVHIESDKGIGVVQIYDVHMRLLFTEDFGKRQKADLSTASLSNGVYILKASNSWIHKLVIEK